MLLSNVAIKNFRSIADAAIPNIGAMNVLIGQNNAGKSALLDAIDGMFDALRGGAPVTVGSTLSHNNNYHNRGLSLPIDIEAEMILSQDERSQLVAEIATANPQVKNAAEQLPTDLTIRVMLRTEHEQKCTWVRSLTAVDASSGASEAVLFEQTRASAVEIADRLERLHSADDARDQINRFFRSFDRSDWEMLKRSPEHSPSLSFLTDRYIRKNSPAVVSKISNAWAIAESLDDFRSRVLDEAQQEQDAARALASSSLETPVKTFGGDSSDVPHYATALLRRIGATSVLHLSEQRRPVGHEEADRLLKLKVRRGGTETLRTIQETIRSLLNVEVDAYEGERTGRTVDRALAAEMDVDNFLVQMNGSGIREALRIVLDNEFQNPKVLLVEEPEVHLHPAIETGVMRYLRSVSNQCQVVVTTHSTNFLDSADMRNVYLVHKNTAGTTVEVLDADRAEAVLPTELGIRLSSVFMYDRLVFVEGPSDEAILREFASTLELNLSAANVGFILMGGVRNFTHFAAEATLSFLSKRRVSSYLVLDRDEASDQDIERLKAVIGERATLHVLDRREIENYLLEPAAVSQFIAQKAELSGSPLPSDRQPTAAAVREEIERQAEGLRTFAEERRLLRQLCAPLLADRSLVETPPTGDASARPQALLDQMAKDLRLREDAFGDVVAQVHEEVEKAWPTSKLDIVPGDYLLDRVCAQFGVRYRKERDGARLASLLSVGMIPNELADVLRSICS
jgi:putative ATP-dependent endonuclease of OLD family